MSRSPNRRKGRHFELLIRNIEEALSASSATIESPGHLRDRHTGRMREVDVLIRDHVGSCEVLIAIECRDRRKKQDVRWIEELASKRDSIGAARIVGISNRHFAKEALLKASALDVIIRTLNELSAEDVKHWMVARSIRLVARRCEAVVVRAVLKVDVIPEVLQKIPLDAKCYHGPNGIVQSSLQLIDMAIAQNPSIFEGVPEDGTRVEKDFNVILPPSSVFLKSGEHSAEVKAIVARCCFWHDVEHRAMDRPIQYLDCDKSLAEVVEFSADAARPGTKLRLVRNTATGIISMSLVTSPEDVPGT